MKFLGRVAALVFMVGLSCGMVPTVQAGVLPLPTSESAAPSDGKADHPVDYRALADMLKDPKARAALIKTLDHLAADAGQTADGKDHGAQSDAGDAEANEPADHSLASRMAMETSVFFQDIGQSVEGTYQRIRRLMNGEHGVFELDRFLAGLWPMMALILLSYGLWLLAERLFRPLLIRLNQWAGRGSTRQHLLRASLSLLFAGGVGLGVLALIYVVGNAVSVWLAGDVAVFARQQALYLNAFVVLELARMMLRLVLVPTYPGLRLFPISAETARFWTARVSWLLLGAGYGMMVVVPVLRRVYGQDAAQITASVIALVGFLWTVTTLLKQRGTIRDALMQAATHRKGPVAGWFLSVLAQIWHVLAVGYVAMVFLVAITRPSDALPFIGSATGYSALILAGGFLVSGLLSQILGGEVRLKDHHRQRLPRLEQRLNTYLPWLLRMLRALIVLAVVAGILAVWRVTNLFEWLTTPVGQRFLSSVFDIFFVIGLALFAWLVIASLIEVKLIAERDHMPSARIKTLLALFRNVVAIALVTMTLMMVLSELGVNIGPLLAGAGVLGLAIGFGAQKLVQDVITGIFIQLENAINTGDTVTAGGVTGTVENLTIRSVGMRDLSGTYHIVPFSSVGVVSNFMRGFAYHKAEYGIAYRESIDDAIAHLRAAFDDLMADPLMKHKILEPIQIPGVTELAASSVNIRVMIKTTPGDQWAVGRAYNRLVKLHFDAAGIEIPFPHTTLYFGEDKSGTPTAAQLQLTRRPARSDTEDGEKKGTDAATRPSQDEATRWMPDKSDVDGDSGH
ncbi:hypothetical protein A9404_12850 [Halothiobacillus diazotrophicus]|uniref:Mechanosensitive ion channel protein MscS n=1 Tax=Halothiobacillus diazotrophicus TaxID=1860122 RepID=A0A191ZJR3_9GAMM|nr:mechanosensitive ion channel domain-containing protein [Halothiobacillus diazotrophicus]ANJ68141.1 hypothetical protein A9404_12850 [Halothiobacillus diazotrophicus]